MERRVRVNKVVSAASKRLYTSKQMGDACEMLVAAELTLAGFPALKVPDNWPGYDVLVQPRDNAQPLRISVKSRTYKRGSAFFDYWDANVFDWIALVILPAGDEPRRRIFIIPHDVAERTARRDRPTSKTAEQRYWRIDEIVRIFAEYENNFALQNHGSKHVRAPE